MQGFFKKKKKKALVVWRLMEHTLDVSEVLKGSKNIRRTNSSLMCTEHNFQNIPIIKICILPFE